MKETLVLNTRVEWSGSQDFDPHTYFTTRKGLRVSGGFRSQILSKAARVSVNATTGKSYDLAKFAYDTDLLAELGATGNQCGSASKVCAHIAQMIDKQSSGESGELVSIGHVNIFYVEGRVPISCIAASDVVGVTWDFDNQEWNVGAKKLDTEPWSVGCRVFIPCN